MLEERALNCPYCGESFTSFVDLSSGSQNYIEDCYVCCRPIEVALIVDDDGELVSLTPRTDTE